LPSLGHLLYRQSDMDNFHCHSATQASLIAAFDTLKSKEDVKKKRHTGSSQFGVVCWQPIMEKQEAQQLMGWPTHGAKSIYLKVKVIELN